MAVRLRGPAAVRCVVSFIHDPIAAMRATYARHGPLVILGDYIPGIANRKQTAFAVGAAYNRAILGDPATWRTAGLVLRGPRGSAQNRLRWGIVRMIGAQHAYYRRLLSAPLRRTSVARMGGDIARLVEDELAAWPVGRPTDLWPLAKHLMRRVSLALLFGEAHQEQGLIIARMIEQHLAANASAGVMGCPVDLPGTPYRRMLRHAEEIERCVIAWAARRRGSDDPHDLLALIVNAPDHTGAPPSDTLIAGHVPTLFGASYETCQTVLAWTLLLLAQHPQIARDLVDEIDGAVHGTPPTLAAVDPLPLLDSVIKESMRLLTPVPYQLRSCTVDTDLVGTPLAIGTRVALSPHLTNRNPEIYREPDRFMPQRWATIDPSPFEYLTFSAGPRMCIGVWFALAVLKIALAAALQRFQVSLIAGSRIDYRISVTMAPTAIPAILLPQDRAFAAVPIRGRVTRLLAAQA